MYKRCETRSQRQSVSSGAPRAGSAVPEARGGLWWASWNARALGHSDLAMKTSKVEFARRLAAKTAILMLRETRAKEHGLRQVLRSLRASHWIIASGDSDSVGGVAIFVARTLSSMRPERVEHIRGRVLEVKTWQGESELSLFCVHKVELGTGEVRRLAAELHNQADAHTRAPLGLRAVFMGDLNFSAAQPGVAGSAKKRADRM